jgi:hypothetical protein
MLSCVDHDCMNQQTTYGLRLPSRSPAAGPISSWAPSRIPSCSGDPHLAGPSTGEEIGFLEDWQRFPAGSASVRASDAVVTGGHCAADPRRFVHRPSSRAGVLLLAVAGLSTVGEQLLNGHRDRQSGGSYNVDQPPVLPAALLTTGWTVSAAAKRPASCCSARPPQSPQSMDITAPARGCAQSRACRPWWPSPVRTFGPFDVCTGHSLVARRHRPAAGTVGGPANLAKWESGGRPAPHDWRLGGGSRSGSFDDPQSSVLTCHSSGLGRYPQLLARCSRDPNISAGLAGGLPREVEEKGKQDGPCILGRKGAARRRTFSQLRTAR